MFQKAHSISKIYGYMTQPLGSLSSLNYPLLILAVFPCLIKKKKKKSAFSSMSMHREARYKKKERRRDAHGAGRCRPSVMVIIPFSQKEVGCEVECGVSTPSRKPSHIFQADESRSCKLDLGLCFTDALLSILTPPPPPPSRCPLHVSIPVLLE